MGLRLATDAYRNLSVMVVSNSGPLSSSIAMWASILVYALLVSGAVLNLQRPQKGVDAVSRKTQCGVRRPMQCHGSRADRSLSAEAMLRALFKSSFGAANASQRSSKSSWATLS